MGRRGKLPRGFKVCPESLLVFFKARNTPPLKLESSLGSLEEMGQVELACQGAVKAGLMPEEYESLVLFTRPPRSMPGRRRSR